MTKAWPAALAGWLTPTLSCRISSENALNVASYRLSPRAELELYEIWLDIAADNEQAADKLTRRIYDKLDLAALRPKHG